MHPMDRIRAADKLEERQAIKSLDFFNRPIMSDGPIDQIHDNTSPKFN